MCEIMQYLNGNNCLIDSQTDLYNWEKRQDCNGFTINVIVYNMQTSIANKIMET